MSTPACHCIGCGKVSVCLRSNLCPACLEGAYLTMRAALEQCDPSVIWDLCRQHYERGMSHVVSIEAQHKNKLCEARKRALEAFQ